MTNIKTRIKKLEGLQPKGLENLSDEELQARLDELIAKPEIQAWLADDSDIGPLRSRALELIAQQDSF